MIATLPIITELFNKFNHLCFNDELPMPRLRLSSSRKFMGLCRRKTKAVLLNKKEYEFTLSFSTQTDILEHELEDTVIHEMIHYYILYKDIKDTSAHGIEFRKMMNDINQRFGRHITISYKRRATNNEECGGATATTMFKPRYRVVCLSTLKSGQTGITVVARTRIFEIKMLLQMLFPITKMEWFWCGDHFIDRFPTSIKPRMYRISAEDAEMHVRKTSQRLVFEGNTVRLVRPDETVISNP